MPIHLAAGNDRSFPTNILLLLQYGADLFTSTPEGETVSSLITDKDVAGVIRKVISSGIIGNPLFLACLSLNDRLIAKLIDMEVDLNQTDVEVVTPLMYATYYIRLTGNSGAQPQLTNVVRMLIESKADPGVVANNGTTALTEARGMVREIMKSSILAEKRAKIVEIFEQEFSGIKGFESKLIQLIVELDGTYESN